MTSLRSSLSTSPSRGSHQFQELSAQTQHKEANDAPETCTGGAVLPPCQCEAIKDALHRVFRVISVCRVVHLDSFENLPVSACLNLSTKSSDGMSTRGLQPSSSGARCRRPARSPFNGRGEAICHDLIGAPRTALGLPAERHTRSPQRGGSPFGATLRVYPRRASAYVRCLGPSLARCPATARTAAYAVVASVAWQSDSVVL